MHIAIYIYTVTYVAIRSTHTIILIYKFQLHACIHSCIATGLYDSYSLQIYVAQYGL